MMLDELSLLQSHLQLKYNMLVNDDLLCRENAHSNILVATRKGSAIMFTFHKSRTSTLADWRNVGQYLPFHSSEYGGERRPRCDMRSRARQRKEEVYSF